MNEDQKNDEDLVETAIDNTQGTALQWASPELKKNTSIVNQSLGYNPLNVQWADSDEFLNNVEFMQKLMDRNYQSLQFATQTVKQQLQYNPNLEHDEYLEQKRQQEILERLMDPESDDEDFSY